MIPKIIHTSWISNNPFPNNVLDCMNSWKNILNDYKIIIWDSNNFNFSECDYIKEAYASKLWAFCADYIRLKALYEQGGVWLDSDVKVYRSFNNLLQYRYFIGEEIIPGTGKPDKLPEVAIMGFEPHNYFIKLILDYYQSIHFIDPKTGIINNKFFETLNKAKLHTINSWGNSFADILPIIFLNILKYNKINIVLNVDINNEYFFKINNTNNFYIVNPNYFSNPYSNHKKNNKVYSLHLHFGSWIKNKPNTIKDLDLKEYYNILNSLNK